MPAVSTLDNRRNRKVSLASDVPNAWLELDLFKNQTGVCTQNGVSWHFISYYTALRDYPPVKHSLPQSYDSSTAPLHSQSAGCM